MIQASRDGFQDAVTAPRETAQMALPDHVEVL